MDSMPATKSIASSFAYLIRFNYSTGTFLLLLPTILGIITAHVVTLPLLVPLLQACIGAFLARSAGCIINDIIDRKLDGKVARTRSRPLAAGDISLHQALIFLGIILSLLTILFFTLPLTAQLLSIAFFIPVFFYPCMKYITRFPQFFLAPLFSSGTLIGSALVTDQISRLSFTFFLGCCCFVIFYDTIYAHQDKIDDQQVGVGSTALSFRKRGPKILRHLLAMSFLLWTLGSMLAGAHRLILLGYFITWYLTNNKLQRTNLDSPDECKKLFNFSMLVLIMVCLINFLGKIVF